MGAVIALHTAYLVTLTMDWLSPELRLTIALCAYATYAVNATQFLLKLRAARLQEARNATAVGGLAA